MDYCGTLEAIGNIYVQQGQTNKGHEIIKKTTQIDPLAAQAFLELVEVLSHTGAVLDAFKIARTPFKIGGQEVPIAFLSNIGVIQSEKREFKLAQ